MKKINIEKSENQILKSKKIYLAPLKQEDLPLLFQWINNREQVLFNSPYKPVHESHHLAWFESVKKRNDIVIFCIRLIKTDKLIGTCQLHNINNIFRSAELQIRIGEIQERGKGYGSEVLCLLLEHAFKDLNLNRISLHVFETNVPAIRLYEKNGFIREGVLRQAAYIDGCYIDIIIMSILKQDYEQTESHRCHSSA